MKKLLLLSLASMLCVGSFAQNRLKNTSGFEANAQKGLNVQNTFAKTTSLDTGFVDNIDADTPVVIYYYGSAPFDSGYLHGMNLYGDKGWAERYKINGAVRVFGVYGMFGGTVNPSSTKTMNMKVWNAGANVPITGLANWYYNGYPTTEVASASRPVTNIGIGINGDNDSGKVFMFATPTSSFAANTSFFVGATLTYDTLNFAGDTIGVYTTNDGSRNSAVAYYQGTDTFINVQNAAMYKNGTWVDNAISNWQMEINYEFAPLVEFDNSTSVSSVTRNNLEFFGAFPNPASNSTNIKVSLKKTADVTVSIMDMNGRVISTVTTPGVVGERLIPVSLNNLAAGTYIYNVKTSNGDQVGSRIIVK